MVKNISKGLQVISQLEGKKAEKAGDEKMNKYKIKYLTHHIQSLGRLPTDQWGQVLSADELMGWFDLDKYLNEYEKACMKMELAAMVEAELFMDRFRLKAL